MSGDRPGSAPHVRVEDLAWGGPGNGPYKLFIGEWGVAEWPCTHDPREYAEATASAIRKALASPCAPAVVGASTDTESLFSAANRTARKAAERSLRTSDAKHTCDVTPPGSSCDGCRAEIAAERRSGEASPVLEINMQSRGPKVRGNHVHGCPECYEKVPCEETCDTEHDLLLKDGTPCGAYVVCEACEAKRGTASVSPEYVAAETKLQAIREYIGAWVEGDNALHALGHIEVLVRDRASAPLVRGDMVLVRGQVTSVDSEEGGLYVEMTPCPGISPCEGWVRDEDVLRGERDQSVPASAGRVGSDGLRDSQPSPSTGKGIATGNAAGDIGRDGGERPALSTASPNASAADVMAAAEGLVDEILRDERTDADQEHLVKVVSAYRAQRARRPYRQCPSCLAFCDCPRATPSSCLVCGATSAFAGARSICKDALACNERERRINGRDGWRHPETPKGGVT